MGATVKIAILANAAQARRELGTVEGSASKLSRGLAAAKAPAAAVLGAIALGSKGAIDAASDLAETQNKSAVIFGKNGAAIEQWASGAAKNLGLSKQAALESAAGFGDMFGQLGFAGEQAAKMSQDVVGLSADLGSFNNLPTADVSDRIAAAFRGEYDSLQALIPNINAARVESEAMAATGKKAAKDLTAQEKATAVLAIVQKDGARAQGDFAKTSSGAANASKIAAAQAQDLSASLGAQLLPAYTAVLQAAQTVLSVLTQHQGVVSVVVAVLAGLAVAVFAVSAAQKVYGAGLAIARGAVLAYTAVQWALNAAMYANPVGLVVLAIVALVAVFVIAYKKSETFRRIVNAALRGVLFAAKVVWAGIKAAALYAWNAIRGLVERHIRFMVGLIRGILATARAVWSAMGAANRALWNGIRGAFAAGVGAAKSKLAELRSKGREILTSLRDMFSPSALYNAGSRLISGLAAGIRARIDSAIQAVRNGLAVIRGLLPGSPIKAGPLKSWNNGGAGKRLMGMLATGIRKGAPDVRASMVNALDTSILSRTLDANLSAGSLSLAGVGGSGTVQNINLNVSVPPGSEVQAGKAIAKVLDAYRRSGGRV